MLNRTAVDPAAPSFGCLRDHALFRHYPIALPHGEYFMLQSMRAQRLRELVAEEAAGRVEAGSLYRKA